ncbi:MAG: DUF6057 family protein [Pseudomonadota bacterium]
MTHVWGVSATALATFEVLRFARRFFARIGQEMGWEAYWIAQSIASGNGFSFSDHRWLFNVVGDGNYYPTAWADPLYTYLLSGMVAISGQHHVYLAGAFNAVCLLVLLFLSYRLGRRILTPAAGALCVLLLVMVSAHRQVLFMNNTGLSACLILVSALVLTRFLERPSTGMAYALGGALGLTVLASPGALLFLPVTAVVLLYAATQQRRVSIPQALVPAVVAALVISPWTLRNQFVFDEFVPVRNGAGSLAFIGTVAAGGTIAPETVVSETRPPWQVERPRDVVKRWAYQPDRRALEEFQMEYAAEVGGSDYEAMNEAQRDGWLMQEAKRYVRANPGLAAQMGVWKLERFVGILKKTGTAVFVLAVLGGLLSLRQKNIAAIILAGWAATYVAPFAIMICYFSRYRFPIEPILVVLCALTLHVAVQALHVRFGGSLPILRGLAATKNTAPPQVTDT